MVSTKQIIENFEEGLNPNNLETSKIKAQVLGYGEISTVFQVEDLDGLASKRMPLFDKRIEAEAYEKIYHQYCSYLKDAGLKLANSHTQIVQLPRKPVTLYIIQEKLPVKTFAHKLIHSLSYSAVEEMIRSIILEIQKVWKYNKAKKPALELALDGQLSNWGKQGNNFIYIDTSTPLFRLEGKEQLNPELFLKTAPSFLRWMIRLFFLKDVMDRYYDFRLVLLDLAANLYKEQRPDIIPIALRLINEQLADTQKEIDEKEVAKYYREDKLIWSLFISFRRLDRWIKTKLLGQPYAYILPGKTKR